MKKYIFKISFILLFFLSLSFGFTREEIDHKIISRIKESGFHHSQVMNTLIFLSDVYGPRLSGTPDYRKSAEWAKKQLENWGLDSVKLEKYKSKFAGWTIESSSVEMIRPRFLSIISLPAAWTGSTTGDIIGVPILVNFHDMDSMKKYEGKIKGKILLLPKSTQRSIPESKVYSDSVLQKTNRQINIFGPNGLGDRKKNNLKKIILKDFKSFGKTKKDKIMEFLIKEEVAAVLEPSYLDNGVLGISEARFGSYREGKAIPYIFISKEDHGRLIRMIKRDIKPVIKINQKTRFYNNPDYHVNVIGDIVGHDQKLKDQIVFIGAHLDSWHGGTGASDNATGVAIMMEVMRIFKQLGLKPRRTIRIGLWGGEEQMFDGSLGYAQKYLADLLGDGKKKEELSKISVYFNHDTGAGKIRGVFLQGNEAIRHFFDACFKPFNYLGVKTISARNSFGTDHVIFDALNIPAFEFIQDPSMNDSHQWHSTMDVTDLISEDSLKQNAVIIATLVYQAAVRDEMFPRKMKVD